MKHEMKLWNAPFEAMRSGEKTIEMRLRDEKRSRIRTGDTIEFVNADTGDKLLCLVTNIYPYASFEEVYKNHDKVSSGYKTDERADPKDMLAYYPQEKIDRYGVVGIEVAIIK